MIGWKTGTDPLIDHPLQVAGDGCRRVSAKNVVRAHRDVDEILRPRLERLNPIDATIGEGTARLPAIPRVRRSEHFTGKSSHSANDVHRVRTQQDRLPCSGVRARYAVIGHTYRLRSRSMPLRFDLSRDLQPAVRGARGESYRLTSIGDVRRSSSYRVRPAKSEVRVRITERYHLDVSRPQRDEHQRAVGESGYAGVKRVSAHAHDPASQPRNSLSVGDRSRTRD